MKKYFVLKYLVDSDENIKREDLLPAGCKFITGVALHTTTKSVLPIEDISTELSFPQNIITDSIREVNKTLFYSYMQTRGTEAESKAFFESDILSRISQVLIDVLVFPILNIAKQEILTQQLRDALTSDLTDYLFSEVGVYEKGKILSSSNFSELIAQETLKFLYEKRTEIFIYDKQVYKQSEPFECGNISLLVNGNSFLLRDYIVKANRKVRQMKKEIISFNQPLEVNSSMTTVFKNLKNSNSELTIRIYIEYEYERTTTHNS